MSMDQEKMLNALRNNECEVTFEKINGDIRVMKCTLNMNNIPDEKHPKNNMPQDYETPLKTIRVFDTNILEWRSFRTDLVKNFKEL